MGHPSPEVEQAEEDDTDFPHPDLEDSTVDAGMPPLLAGKREATETETAATWDTTIRRSTRQQTQTSLTNILDESMVDRTAPATDATETGATETAADADAVKTEEEAHKRPSWLPAWMCDDPDNAATDNAATETGDAEARASAETLRLEEGGVIGPTELPGGLLQDLLFANLSCMICDNRL